MSNWRAIVHVQETKLPDKQLRKVTMLVACRPLVSLCATTLYVIPQDDQRTRLKDAHFLLLLLFPLLGIGLGLLLRLLSGFFLVFEFLYSGVAAISRVCKSPSGIGAVSTGTSFASSHRVRWTAGAYRLAFVSCSSPPSSSELSRPGSAFRSTSSRHDCRDRLNAHRSDAGPTTAFAAIDTSR